MRSDPKKLAFAAQVKKKSMQAVLYALCLIPSFFLNDSISFPSPFGLDVPENLTVL